MPKAKRLVKRLLDFDIHFCHHTPMNKPYKPSRKSLPAVKHTCLNCGRQTCDQQPEDYDPIDCKHWKGSGCLERTETGLPVLKTQEDALAWLKQRCPDFFNDPNTRDLSIVILMELGDELNGMTPTKLVSILSGIQTLLYKFSTAAFQSLKGGKKMTRRFVENYAREHPDKINGLTLKRERSILSK